MKTLALPPNNYQLRVHATRARVAQLLRKTEDELAVIQFEAAYAWLHYIGCDDVYAARFAATQEFWLFWRMTWHEKDAEFLAHYDANTYSVAHVDTLYAYFHDPEGKPMNSQSVFAAHHGVIKRLAVKR